MELKKYKGGCHCGSISYLFSAPEITNGLRCNCSICIRKGAVMTAFTVPPEDMNVEVLGDSLSTYQFGSKTAKHHFCNKCGIYTFHEPQSKPGHFRLNVGCIEGVNPLALVVDTFDGASL
ncbi:MAG: GFA family protein [Sideroxydans sp.]|nr:GFA family protein [Sideroxydans sp.]